MPFFALFLQNNYSSATLRPNMSYLSPARKIYKVGISFSSETGTVNDFAYEPCE